MSLISSCDTNIYNEYDDDIVLTQNNKKGSQSKKIKNSEISNRQNKNKSRKNNNISCYSTKHVRIQLEKYSKKMNT